MENIESIFSSESKLQISSICPVRIRSRKEDIDETQFRDKSKGPTISQVLERVLIEHIDSILTQLCIYKVPKMLRV